MTAYHQMATIASNTASGGQILFSLSMGLWITGIEGAIAAAASRPAAWA
jgi:hypothetical protein